MVKEFFLAHLWNRGVCNRYRIICLLHSLTTFLMFLNIRVLQNGWLIWFCAYWGLWSLGLYCWSLFLFLSQFRFIWFCSISIKFFCEVAILFFRKSAAILFCCLFTPSPSFFSFTSTSIYNPEIEKKNILEIK